MKDEFPGAVPELPVDNVDQTAAYYVKHLGFNLNWGGEEGEGIAGISQGHCRIFLTGRGFRERHRNAGQL